MSNQFFDERKVKSNDIVNGLARRDIFDSKGVLLVKEGTRISEAHYARMREEGLIQEDHSESSDKNKNLSLHYVDPNSVHARLDKQIFLFSQLQKEICQEADANHKNQLIGIAQALEALCDENIFQVIGELYLMEKSKYNYVKPLYITASLIELIKRYNAYTPDSPIEDDKKDSMIYAALLHNLGLVNNNLYNNEKTLSVEERNAVRKNYPQISISMIQNMGFNDKTLFDAVANHNVAASSPSFEALLLRTPFIYAGIAMPEQQRAADQQLINPSREFAKMFSEQQLDPILGGLFLKINGLAPVGSILVFETLEKALVIKGPDDNNISSSQIRMLTNKNGVQFNRPGDKLYLHKIKMNHKGIADHHQFAWGKFAPFTMWQR
ncbi:MAG: hypothetical protein QNJ56_05670 [Gammaproteobacteria bacterium]|nr:hypothetical protein [Gammaproteobacteria bacterium]